MGSIFEGGDLRTYSTANMTSENLTEEIMTSEKTLGYLFDFKGTKKETTVGSVFFKLANPDYYGAWFSVLLLDFNFLKEYNSVTGQWHETIQSYFFKMIGSIGILAFVLMFINTIRGFITQ